MSRCVRVFYYIVFLEWIDFSTKSAHLRCASGTDWERERECVQRELCGRDEVEEKQIDTVNNKHIERIVHEMRCTSDAMQKRT